MKKNSDENIKKAHAKEPEVRKKLIRESVKKWRSGFNEEQKIKYRDQHHEWVKANPERIKALKEADRKRHPEEHRMRAKKRRALSRKAGKFPDKEIVSKRINHFGGCCYCDRIEDLTLEHLKPISKGGTHREGNLYGSCKSCNSSKQDQNWMIWYRKQRFYKPEREIEIRRMSLTVIKCNKQVGSAD